MTFGYLGRLIKLRWELFLWILFKFCLRLFPILKGSVLHWMPIGLSLLRIRWLILSVVRLDVVLLFCRPNSISVTLDPGILFLAVSEDLFIDPSLWTEVIKTVNPLSKLTKFRVKRVTFLLLISWVYHPYCEWRVLTHTHYRVRKLEI